MRVLLSADAVGGVWAYATDLRAALEPLGVEAVLATVGPQAPPDGSPHLPGRLEWQEDPWDDVARAGAWLRDLAAQERADVVHLGQLAAGAEAWPCPVLVVGHSCVASWHEAVRGTPAPASWDGYRDAVRRGLHAADEVVAPSAAMLDALRRHYGLGDRGRVVHNGVAPGPAPAAAREPVVLAAGRLWDEAKGLDALDAAAAACPWPVEVAGAADGADAAHARLLGPLPRAALRERMARAAVFAHPARYEPFGLAPLEAAQAGCALVLGDIPSLRELWDGAALFVAPGDPGALGRALQRLAADDALRERLALAARGRARDRTAERMARAYLATYRTLASTPVTA